MTSLRQQLAARTPGLVRKGVRMAEHYARRQAEWIAVLREMRGVSVRDRLVLYGSAALAPLTALARLDGFQPPCLLTDAELDVAGIGRFAVRHATDDIIHVLSAREPAVRRELEARLRPGDTFVDAGANIGFYSILAARLVGPTGNVVAVEMMPPTAERLRRQINLNAAGVRVIEQALSNSDGQLIVATSEPGKFGQASIVTDCDDAGRAIRHSVRTVRLDTALADVGPIRLIKMDLEGAEYLALSGGPQVLARTETLLFESNSHDEAIFVLLRDAGFVVALLDGNDYRATRRT